MEIVLAIVIGAAFGAVLDRVGAANPNVIVNMLRLKDLRLMKAILLAIGTGSVLMFGGQMLGLADVGHMSVKAAYIGVAIGGLLLGFGWALSGFCPGTGVVAAATGRIDALLFILGGLLGAFAYTLAYAPIKATGILGDILDGKSTLGAVSGANWPALLPSVSGEWLGLALGAVFIVVAFALPEQPGRSAQPAAAE